MGERGCARERMYAKGNKQQCKLYASCSTNSSRRWGREVGNEVGAVAGGGGAKFPLSGADKAGQVLTIYIRCTCTYNICMCVCVYELQIHMYVALPAQVRAVQLCNIFSQHSSHCKRRSCKTLKVTNCFLYIRYKYIDIDTYIWMYVCIHSVHMHISIVLYTLAHHLNNCPTYICTVSLSHLVAFKCSIFV